MAKMRDEELSEKEKKEAKRLRRTTTKGPKYIHPSRVKK